MAGAHNAPRRTGSAIERAPVAAVSRFTAAANVTVGLDVMPFAGTSNDYQGYSQGAADTPEQREAWTAYDKIPEVKTLVQGTSNLLSQCRLFVGRREWSNGHEEPVPGRNEDTGNADPELGEELVLAAEDALSRYVDATGVQTGLIRGIAENFQVVGECRMVGYYVDDKEVPTGPGGEERWIVCSPGAIMRTPEQGITDSWMLQVNHSAKIRLPFAVVHRFDWNGGRYPGLPSAWVIGALDVCRDLRSFTMALRAAARSGIPADLFLVPTEASPLAVNPVGWGPGEEGAIITAQSAADDWASKVENLIGDYVMTVLEDMNAGNTIVPGVLAVEGRFVEFFKKLSFSRLVDRGIAELVRDARVRLAAAADCAPEMLKGLGQTNRWNGAQVAEDEYRRYYKPKADAFADQWTQKLLWADLKDRGFAPEEYRKIRVLVDSSALIADPDYTTVAPAAFAAGAIGPSGFRRLLRIPDSAAPTPEELAWMDARATPAAGPGQGDTGAPGSPKPVDKSKGSIVIESLGAVTSNDLAERLAAIEIKTRTRLEEACEAALDKAIEKGANHLTNWARKAGGDLKARAEMACPDRPLLTLLDRAECLALADDNLSPDEKRRREVLFAAALVALVLSWRRIAASAYTSALKATGKTLPQGEIDAAIERSAEVLRDSMMLLADEKLFGAPGVPPATVGELTNLRIPTPLLMRVLATAGGSPGIEAGIFASVAAAMGLVFGPLIDRLLPTRQGLRWVYGDPAERQQPYPPHEELDGQVFTGPDDPKLAGSVFSANGQSWPGDHAGCRCLWLPVYGTPGT